MARIRILLEDDQGREINPAAERIYELKADLSRLRGIEAAVEQFKQTALPELEAELLELAQREFMSEEKKEES